MTQCTYKKFTEDADGNHDLHFGAYYPLMFQYGGVGGKVYCEGSDCEATMGSSDNRSEFRVLATDYTTYDIGYVCMDMIDTVMKADFIMISSRDNSKLSDDTKNTVANIINEKVPGYNFAWWKMLDFVQKDCEYTDTTSY